MAQWLRFTHAGAERFGKLFGDAIDVFSGDLFDAPQSTGQRLLLAEVRLLPPVQPSKAVVPSVAHRSLAMLAASSA